MTELNPFEIRDGVLRGVIEPLRTQDGKDVLTNVAVCESSARHGHGPTVLLVPGLWNPIAGSEVRLAAPERQAHVCSVRHDVDEHGNLHAIVYLDDPEITR